jgi:uncharacterized membrane protein YgcG
VNRLALAALAALLAAAIVWRYSWYALAWLAGCAWASLRSGWRDGSTKPRREESDVSDDSGSSGGDGSGGGGGPGGAAAHPAR